MIMLVLLIIMFQKHVCNCELYFHPRDFVWWFVSTISQKLLNRFQPDFGWRRGLSPEYIPLTFSADLDKGFDPGISRAATFSE